MASRTIAGLAEDGSKPRGVAQDAVGGALVGNRRITVLPNPPQA
jgi:hypothetical protein